MILTNTANKKNMILTNTTKQIEATSFSMQSHCIIKYLTRTMLVVPPHTSQVLSKQYA